MILTIFRSAFLILVTVLSSQGIFHIIGNAKALSQVSTATFAEQRNILDGIIGVRLLSLYAMSLIFGIGCLILMRKSYRSFVFIATTIALITIIVDLIIAVQINIPINTAFKSYPIGSNSWSSLQSDWVNAIVLRGCFLSVGLLGLIISVFPSDKTYR
jgi:hypothetical protein